MTWTYSGDPSSGDKDKYRFLVGDTDQTDPILQDEEITFIVSEYSDHSVRLFNLYDRAADFFARKIKRTVGPITEEPLERQRHFEAKAAYYKGIVVTSGLSMPKSTPVAFSKGLHDNARY